MSKMENEQHTQIMVALGKLETRVTDGFQTTNTHLTQLNSKVATHEGRLNHMDVEDGKLQGVIEALKNTDREDSMVKSKWVERGVGLLLYLIGFLAVLLLVRSGILNLDKNPQTLEEVQQQMIELQAEAQKLHLQDLNNSSIK